MTLSSTQNQIPQNFDILCAGFPCQAFSIAGLQKGFDNTRGTLFFEIAKITQKHKPKVLFLENVKNLKNHDKGKTLSVIQSTLEKLGYCVYDEVLNSATHANIPQNRRGFLS
ncbi:DNA (cytosine-5-)-methyltransferase [Campylobacter sp. MIT 21-1682]|uniref:DNA (cytosine-5-)-methyltransferase n=1 Tax=Campylobacter sp. MIT 21-1682 TaxID=2993734 RepID=UPI00224B1660|nr:DNA (cytosine-5-)-methyltransferase [Campylobacter sp. MIT 21-1682]MCX2750989.1 DNA (cytosine-5-)-methyltransferase [Campylobacter sp. MIT 21-1682]